MIEDILPPIVTAADTFHDPPEAVLYPEEELLIGNAVEGRRREFTTARHCARTALRRLGFAPAPVLPGRRGEPRWPDGVVGSITHCTGYRAAVLGNNRRVASIGIDAEPNEPLPAGVLDSISLPEERARISRLPRGPRQVCWDRLLFCAKETIYKAWYPLTETYLDFEDASVTMDAETGGFTARILVPGGRFNGRPLTGFTGRWLVRDGLIVSAIVLPAS